MEQELSDVLVVLADRLGVAAHEVFGIFVRAQLSIGVVSIVVNVLGVLFAFYVGKRLHMYLSVVWKDNEGDWLIDELNFFEPLLVITVVSLGILVFVDIFSMLGVSVLRIVAPEYMAAKEIIGILNP